jgi:flagellar biosynthetic protein FlhB
MSNETPDDDKPHPPSEHKLAEMRKQGDVPENAPDLAWTVAFAVGLGGCAATAEDALRPVLAAWRTALAAASAPTPGAAWPAVVDAGENIGAALRAWLPALAVAALAAASVGIFRLLATVGPVFSLDPFFPKPERFFSAARLKRVFLLDAHGRAELAFNLVKFVVAGAAAFFALRGSAHALLRTSTLTPAAVAAVTADAAFAVAAAIVAVAAAAGVVDLLRRIMRFLAKARMDDEELKKERKDDEGSPEVRSMKRRAQAAFRRRLERARRARVVDAAVMNPTHYFVGLRFDPAEGAPRVWVKAEDAEALELRAAATAAGVPVREEPALARGLYEIAEGDWAPVELHEALAAVYRWAREVYEESGRDLPWESRGDSPPSTDAAQSEDARLF